MYLFVAVCALLTQPTVAAISGNPPPAGSCICLTTSGVNVRDSGCGTIIGSAGTGQCFYGNGKQNGCTLSGTYYDYYAVQFGSREGWMAGNFLSVGSASQCETTGSGGECSQVEIVTRAEWGARPPQNSISSMPGKPIGMAFVHHTAGGHCSSLSACTSQVKNIQNYHMDSLGWSDIGYNFLIGEDGRAYEGRGWDKIGAHASGYNDEAVGISVMGTYTSSSPNTAAQNAVRNALDCAVRQGVLSSNYEMFGHRDGGCTACPGDSFYATIRTWDHYSFRTIPKYCKREYDENV